MDDLIVWIAYDKTRPSSWCEAKALKRRILEETFTHGLNVGGKNNRGGNCVCRFSFVMEEKGNSNDTIQ